MEHFRDTSSYGSVGGCLHFGTATPAIHPDCTRVKKLIKAKRFSIQKQMWSKNGNSYHKINEDIRNLEHLLDQWEKLHFIPQEKIPVTNDRRLPRRNPPAHWKTNQTFNLDSLEDFPNLSNVPVDHPPMDDRKTYCQIARIFTPDVNNMDRHIRNIAARIRSFQLQMQGKPLFQEPPDKLKDIPGPLLACFRFADPHYIATSLIQHYEAQGATADILENAFRRSPPPEYKEVMEREKPPKDLSHKQGCVRRDMYPEYAHMLPCTCDEIMDEEIRIDDVAQEVEVESTSTDEEAMIKKARIADEEVIKAEDVKDEEMDQANANMDLF